MPPIHEKKYMKIHGHSDVHTPCHTFLPQGLRELSSSRLNAKKGTGAETTPLPGQTHDLAGEPMTVRSAEKAIFPGQRR
jgi:hypothetical protein